MIKNLTPHPLTIVLGNQNITLPAPEKHARVDQKTTFVGNLPLGNALGAEYHVPIYTATLSEVIGLPPVVEGTYYIVSRMVADAAWDRNDLLIASDTVRDPNGRIVGCRSLSRVIIHEEDNDVACVG